MKGSKTMTETENKLFYQERLDTIMKILKTQGSISVMNLSKEFNVSGATIRTDLKHLEEEGLLLRTHGGAILKNETIQEININHRSHQEAKMKIAVDALQEVNDGDNILLDNGTTVLAFANTLKLSNKKNVTIYTNDMVIASLLEDNPEFTVFMLGGKVRNGYHYTIGSSVLSALATYNFTSVFLSSSAISPDTGSLSVPTEDLADVKRAMISTSKHVVLLADSSKIGSSKFCTFGELSDIDLLIMDNAITGIQKQMIENLVKKVHYVL